MTTTEIGRPENLTITVILVLLSSITLMVVKTIAKHNLKAIQLVLVSSKEAILPKTIAKKQHHRSFYRLSCY